MLATPSGANAAHSFSPASNSAQIRSRSQKNPPPRSTGPCANRRTIRIAASDHGPASRETRQLSAPRSIATKAGRSLTLRPMAEIQTSRYYNSRIVPRARVPSRAGHTWCAEKLTMPSSEKELLLRTLHDGREALGNSLAGLDETLAHAQATRGRLVHPRVHGAYGALRAVLALAASHRHADCATSAESNPRGKNRSPGHRPHPPHRCAARSPSIRAVHLASRGTRRLRLHPRRGHALRRILRDDLRCWVTDHPLIPGPVTCYETLGMMAAHPKRHAQQIIADPRGCRKGKRARGRSASSH